MGIFAYVLAIVMGWCINEAIGWKASLSIVIAVCWAIY